MGKFHTFIYGLTPESWADIEQKVEDLSKKAKTVLPNLIQTCSGYLNASLNALNEFSQNLVAALEEPEEKPAPAAKPEVPDLIHFSQAGTQPEVPLPPTDFDKRVAEMVENFKRSVPIQPPAPVDKYEQRLERKTQGFSDKRRYNIATFREMGFSNRDLVKVADIVASMRENAEFPEIFDRWEAKSKA